MKNRMPEPGKENRFKFTLDDGTVLSGVLTFDDGATQVGSSYTKGNVLPDDVCDLLGIPRDSSEPKDAFVRLRKIGRHFPQSTYELVMRGLF
jgi:hypothetical protein